jgi:hypothetical protein
MRCEHSDRRLLMMRSTRHCSRRGTHISGSDGQRRSRLKERECQNARSDLQM